MKKVLFTLFPKIIWNLERTAYEKGYQDGLRRTKDDHVQSPKLKVGESIHLHSRNGQYKIVRISSGQLILTCNKWKREKEAGKRADDTISVPVSDFKCHVGSKTLVIS